MGLRNSLAGAKIRLPLILGLFLGLSLTLPGPIMHTACAQAGQQPVAAIRVLNLVYDPIIESMGGKRLNEVFGWNDPVPMAEIYNDEIYERSHGFVDLQVIDTIVLDAYPPQWNGYVYTDENYTQGLHSLGKDGPALFLHQCQHPGLGERTQPCLGHDCSVPGRLDESKQSRHGDLDFCHAGSGHCGLDVFSRPGGDQLQLFKLLPGGSEHGKPLSLWNVVPGHDLEQRRGCGLHGHVFEVRR